MPATRPTIADVARKAGVSIATVSRVLNGTTPVGTEKTERVQATISALNYIPHAAARTLASRRTDTIGLLLQEFTGAFFEPMLRGVEAGVNEAGFDLLIHSTRAHPGTMQRRPLGEHNTDGLLVFTESLDARELTRLHNIGFPVVLLHQSPPDSLKIPVVTIENQSGAKKIVDHLIEIHHCKRIVFLKGPQGQEDSMWREIGYRQSLQSHQLTYDSCLVGYGAFNREEARASVEQLLTNGIQFDSVFAGDDDAAVGVYQALKHLGSRIPQDIALVGFDDQLFASTLTPTLTTVNAPTEQVGYEAVQVLARLLKGEPVKPRLVLPTELIIRESCGCQP